MVTLLPELSASFETERQGVAFCNAVEELICKYAQVYAPSLPREGCFEDRTLSDEISLEWVAEPGSVVMESHLPNGPLPQKELLQAVPTHLNCRLKIYANIC